MTDAVPLGLYVHWPYCSRICPYCDFNVYKAALADPDALVAALHADLERWRERLGPRRLASVHFGGGTPSLMAPAAVAGLIEAAERLFGFAPNVELGLEANPNEAGAFAGLAAAGVERLSLGVQAFDDASLNRLGRDHDAAGARAAVDRAQAVFARVSIDLIYAREGQSLKAWRAELDQALSLGLGHLSLYQLTIEPGTAFERQARRGALTAPDDDLAAALFEATQAQTAAAGLPAYEISNHARTPDDQSRHNRIYWEGGDWIGIGPGAHSRVGRGDAGGRIAWEAARRPADYIAGADAGRAPARLSPLEEAQERILMGVRLVEAGVDLAAVEAATGVAADAEGLSRAVAKGWLTVQDDRARLTGRGRLFADAAATALAPI